MHNHTSQIKIIIETNFFKDRMAHRKISFFYSQTSALGARRERYIRVWSYIFPLFSQLYYTWNDPTQENVPWHCDFMISVLLINKCLVLEAIDF